MSRYARNLLLTVILILCQHNMFAAIVPSRYSRRTTLVVINALSVVLLGVYALLGLALGVDRSSQMPLVVFTLPFLAAGLIMTSCRDGRFWYVFFFCDALGAAVSESGFLLGMLAGGGDIAIILLRGIPTIAVTAFVLLVLRKPFCAMLENRDMHWKTLALVEFILEVMIYFMAAYPSPLEGRPQDYISVLLTLVVLMVVLASNVLILGGLKRAADDRLYLAMVQRQYENMMHNQQQVRHARHDMKHHLKLIEGLAAQGNVEGLMSYLSELEEDVDSTRVSDLCRSQVANTVLSWYEAEARQQGIAFTCRTDIPPEDPSASVDLCTVLSNALQNAVEACAGQAAPWVRISAKPAGATLLLVVENSCPTPPEMKNDLPVTTKKAPGHGLGLSSIRATVENRGGYFRIETEPGLFRLSVALTCLQVPLSGQDPAEP